jgi:HEAT repeat protein
MHKEGQAQSMSPQPDLLIRKLIEKLRDRDPRTRRCAAGALGLNGQRALTAVPALAALLNDEDSRVRMEVEKVLDHLRMVTA